VKKDTFGAVMAVLILVVVWFVSRPKNMFAEFDAPQSIPDHVCLPSVAEEYAAWNELQKNKSPGTVLAKAIYQQRMLPACSLWQRITAKELDPQTLRARIFCLNADYPPDSLVVCVQSVLNPHN